MFDRMDVTMEEPKNILYLRSGDNHSFATSHKTCIFSFSLLFYRLSVLFSGRLNFKDTVTQLRPWHLSRIFIANCVSVNCRQVHLRIKKIKLLDLTFYSIIFMDRNICSHSSIMFHSKYWVFYSFLLVQSFLVSFLSIVFSSFIFYIRTLMSSVILHEDIESVSSNSTFYSSVEMNFYFRTVLEHVALWAHLFTFDILVWKYWIYCYENYYCLRKKVI